VDVLEIWLTRFSRLNTVALEERAAADGLTASEVAVLGALDRDGPVLSPTRLQGVVIQSPGGLTKTLRRLEDAGLIRRRTDPEDRRALLVELTAKGRRAAERAAELVRTHYGDLLDGVDRTATEVVVRSLLDRLEAMSGMPSTAGVGRPAEAGR
jgi:DNA-binding MarR family transcriptional regulator